MQTTAAELRARILEADAGLNRVGKAYLDHLTDWQEHSTITTSLKHSLQVSLQKLCTASVSFAQLTTYLSATSAKHNCQAMSCHVAADRASDLPCRLLALAPALLMLPAQASNHQSSFHAQQEAL